MTQVIFSTIVYRQLICHAFLLSLFARWLAIDVTNILAITDPFFIFHWFCLVFLHTWFQSHQLHGVYLTLCFPSCPCWKIVLFVCDVHFSVGVRRVFVPTCYFVHFGCFGVLSAFIKQLRLYQVRSPAPDFPATNTHPLHNFTYNSLYHNSSGSDVYIH